MTTVIVYLNPQHEDINQSSLHFMYPTGIFDPYETALKDTPEGSPFFILSVEDFPEDKEFMDAWEIDFTNPDGYGIGHQKWYSLNYDKIPDLWHQFHGNPMPDNVLAAHEAFVHPPI